MPNVRDIAIVAIKNKDVFYAKTVSLELDNLPKKIEMMNKEGVEKASFIFLDGSSITTYFPMDEANIASTTQSIKSEFENSDSWKALKTS